MLHGNATRWQVILVGENFHSELCEILKFHWPKNVYSWSRLSLKIMSSCTVRDNIKSQVMHNLEKTKKCSGTLLWKVILQCKYTARDRGYWCRTIGFISFFFFIWNISKLVIYIRKYLDSRICVNKWILHILLFDHGLIY